MSEEKTRAIEAEKKLAGWLNEEKIRASEVETRLTVWLSEEKTRLRKEETRAGESEKKLEQMLENLMDMMSKMEMRLEEKIDREDRNLQAILHSWIEKIKDQDLRIVNLGAKVNEVKMRINEVESRVYKIEKEFIPKFKEMEEDLVEAEINFDLFQKEYKVDMKKVLQEIEALEKRIKFFPKK